MKAYASTAEYIKDQPKAVQARLKAIRAVIRKYAPKEATERISYGMPSFQLNGYLVYFAGFKNHTSVYPALSGSAALKKQLDTYRSGRGTLKFPNDKPLPLALIGRFVRHRVKEQLAKRKKK